MARTDAEHDNSDKGSSRTLVQERLAELSEGLRGVSLKLHDEPEQAFKEIKSRALIVSFLKEHGGDNLEISASKSGLETAFVATASCNVDGKQRGEYAHIGFCSEYDALPMGHACGHNLIAISGIATFLAVKHFAEQTKTPVKLTLFGTPAEETLGGKIYMIEAGDFDGLDACMMLHPGNADLVYPTYLALQGFEVTFTGRESHASGAPWDGLNALDAVINAYNAVGLLRQQILPTDRVHGVITDGGVAPNIIPAHTGAHFLTRSTQIAHLSGTLLPRVLNCMTSGAVSTGCQHAVHFDPPYFDVMTNSVLTEVYADELQTHVLSEEDGAGKKLPPRAEQESISRGSTDMGNVCYKVPSIHNVFNIGCAAEIHTVEFMNHARTEVAHERTLRRVQCLAMTAIAAATDPQLLRRAKDEFEHEKRSRGGDKGAEKLVQQWKAGDKLLAGRQQM
ncbi:hypothetical protein RI367_001934 [Sorochytrium milnesiophthora]